MVRHAETEDNRNKIVSGKHSKTTLTEEGKRQAIETQDIVAQITPKISCIVTSEMQRTIDTARLISDCDALRNLPRSTNSGINERDYGAAEGLSDEKRIALRDAGKIAGEETKDSLSKRTLTAISETMDDNDGTPLFVTHGGNIRRVLGQVFGENAVKQARVPNCGVFEFVTSEKGDGSWKVNMLEMDKNKKLQRRDFGVMLEMDKQ